MASALVISGIAHKPSDIFFAWMKELGVLPNLHEDTVYRFWGEQITLAFAHYRR